MFSKLCFLLPISKLDLTASFNRPSEGSAVQALCNDSRAISVGKFRHAIWPCGDGKRIYVGGDYLVRSILSPTSIRGCMCRMPCRRVMAYRDYSSLGQPEILHIIRNICESSIVYSKVYVRLRMGGAYV
jgi:hypothetical protein